MKTKNNSNYQSHKIKEAKLIQRIIEGEKELYEILLRRNNQKLYRVIRSYLKDEAEIADVMQNTYLIAFTKLDQFKHNAAFSTWLIRIGINEALARLKEKGKLYHLKEGSDKLRSNTLLELPDSKQLNPQDKMMQREAKQLLENAIDQLGIKYKSVYMLAEVEEMRLKEVAVALDISLSNAKIRLHRAKKMLKEKLYAITSDKNIFEFGFNKCDQLTESVMAKIKETN